MKFPRPRWASSIHCPICAIRLIREGALPCPGVLEEPGSYQTGGEWERLLADSIRQGGKPALVWLLSIRRYAGLCGQDGTGGSRGGAVGSGGDHAARAQYCQGSTPSAAQSGANPRRSSAYTGRLPPGVRALGSPKVLLIEALLNTVDTTRSERMFNGNIELTDVREGEVKLTICGSA